MSADDASVLNKSKDQIYLIARAAEANALLAKKAAVAAQVAAETAASVSTGEAALNAELVSHLATLDPAVNPCVSVAGRGAAGDQGGGVFVGVLVAGGPAVDNALVFASSNAPWRWARSYSGAIDVRWFGARTITAAAWSALSAGAKTTWAAANVTAIRAAISATPLNGALYFPAGETDSDYKINAKLTFPRGIRVIGDHVLGTMVTQTAAATVFEIAPTVNNEAFIFDGFHLYAGTWGLDWVAATPGDYVSRFSSLRNIQCAGQTSGACRTTLAMIGTSHEKINFESCGQYGIHAEGEDLLGVSVWSALRITGTTVRGMHLKNTSTVADQGAVTLNNPVLEYNMGPAVYVYGSQVVMNNPHWEGNGASSAPGALIPDLEMDTAYAGAPSVYSRVQMNGGYFSTPWVTQSDYRIKWDNHTCHLELHGTRMRAADVIDCNNKITASALILIHVDAPRPTVINCPGNFAAYGTRGSVEPFAQNARKGNRCGRVSISGSRTTARIYYNQPEPDTNYTMAVTPSVSTGDAGCTRVVSVDKYTDGFLLTVEVAPNVGAVAFDWQLIRQEEELDMYTLLEEGPISVNNPTTYDAPIPSGATHVAISAGANGVLPVGALYLTDSTKAHKGPSGSYGAGAEPGYASTILLSIPSLAEDGATSLVGGYLHWIPTGAGSSLWLRWYAGG